MELTKIKIGDDAHQYASLFHTGEINRPMGVVGLNPSIFKKGKNATVTILMQIAEREGFDSLFITNLYSYISPDPKRLKKVKNPVSIYNDVWIKLMSQKCEKILCIWGNAGEKERIEAVMPKIKRKAYAIGLTKSGQPRHVLHTRKDVKLIKL